MRRFSVAFILVIVCAVVMQVEGVAGSPRPIPVTAHWPFPMVISPNGRYMATTSNARADAVELYDLTTGRMRILTTTGVNQFYEYRMSCYAMAFSPDSKTLAHGGAELGSYNAINTWDTATGTHLKTFALTTVGQSVLFTPDGKNIVAAAKDNRVHVWNAVTGQEVRTIPGPGGQIISLALSPNGRHVAIGTIIPSCRLQMRDVRSGRVLWTQPVASPEAEVASLSFSPDGSTLARGGQYNNLYLHDARTGALRATLSDPVPGSLKNWGGNDASRIIVYSPDGKFLAGGGPFRVVVWSARTRKVVLRPEHAGEPFAFQPRSGRFAATLSDIPVPHPAGRHTYTMRPPSLAGNVSFWALK